MAFLQALFQRVDESEHELVQLLCELIRFQTVNTGVMPTGDELPLVEFLRDRLAVEGIASEILVPAERRANLVARLPGRTGTPRLLYMAHTDVVPVEDAGVWTYPPFSGTVADGRVWGRGASDMKDMLAAEAMALILLKRAGVTLAGDLIFAAGADEETGGKYGFGWLAENAPEAIQADVALNEGGGGCIRTDEGLVYTVMVGEKGRLEAHITVRGRGAHASVPWAGENPAFKLAEILRRLEAYQPELNVSQEIFAALPALLGRGEPVTAGNVDAVADEIMAVDQHLAYGLRGLSRMTIVPTMISGGIKSNSVPTACKLVCDVRILPHQDQAYVRSQIGQILAGLEGVSYELVYTAAPSASPYNTEFAAAVRRATEAATGRTDLRWLPSLTTGFTDSRLVRPLGVTVYGFGPSHPDSDPNFPSGVHGANENTEISGLVLMTKMFIALACDVLKARVE
jgi:acetylornithine deacetylase/succinyl-diaminopimelate desuccinylase-like protein